MKKSVIVLSLVVFATANLFSQPDDFPKLSGPYLSQKPPGMIPEIFAPGIISTEKNELNCVFMPDGNEVYFSEWHSGVNTIMTIRFIAGQWSRRTVAEFSGRYSDVDPYITADGKKLFFSSMRPLDGKGEPKDSDLWYVERGEDGSWSVPIHMTLPNSPGKDDYYTSICNEGTLYFSVFASHGNSGDIYRSILIRGQYSSPEKMMYGISTEYNEHDPFISADGSTLIFSSERPGGFGRNDLYKSFRMKDGTWTPPQNMGDKVNSDGYDYCPILSHDEKYLFFTRNVNRNGDIYWVSAKIIEELRPKE